MPITIKATIVSPVIQAGTKPRRNHRHPGETRISQRQAEEHRRQSDGDARTTETHGASAVFPGARRARRV